MKINQEGVAHILSILFLVGTIVAGTYLVQQRTGFIPYAQENNSCEIDSDCGDLPQYCDGDQTRQCGGGYCDSGTCQRACEIVEGNPLSCGDSSAEGDPPQNTNPTSDSCSAQGLVSCSSDEADNGWVVNNEGYMQGDTCYRKIYEYASSSETGLCCNTPLITAADQAECKIDAQNTAGGGAGQPSTQTCPDEGLIYCDEKEGEKFKVQKHNARWNEELNRCDYDFRNLEGNECADKTPGEIIEPGESKEVTSGGQSLSEKTLACTPEQAETPYIDAKLQTNLIYYYAIITGTPERCVKSDLTLPEFIYADGVDGGSSRRLFTCSGKDGSIKFRVMSSDGQGLVQTTQDFPTDPNDPGFPGYSNVRKAEEMLNMSL